MASCCEDKSCEITGLREKHSRVLKIVLLVNALMFLVEAIFGWLSHSTALLADSLDMLGDALVYGMSLYVLAGTQRQQAKVALAKSGFMLLFGLFVLGEAAYKIAFPVLPNAQAMGIVGAIALMANLMCFALLYRHRADNLNMSSTWLCSRNDLMANASVLVAAALGNWLLSGWPDIVVGTCIALLFLQSAYVVLLQALRQMKAQPPAAPIAMHRK